MLGADHSETLAGGKLLLFTRNGIFQARVYKGERQYLFRSLKTTDLKQARNLALRFLHETEFKQTAGMPLQQLTLAAVINEYVAMRQRQNEQGARVTTNTSIKQHTSIYMLRQMQRVVKFWVAYCGNLSVEKIDNAVLADYIGWRKDYYRRIPKDKWPRNAKLNPTDKTLEWETTLIRTILKYATERGYRGNAPLPTYRFRALKKIVRPAFSVTEYAQLYRGMRNWIKEPENECWQYTRQLLRDYVLILANSGLRVGEANNILESDISVFYDELKRKNYRIEVSGKTGRRTVIPRTTVVPYIERVLKRNAEWQERWETMAKRAKNRKKEDRQNWLFRMADGNKIITLIDQFNALLKYIGQTENRFGEKFTLYSLRHFYAKRMLERGRVEIYDIARNMGTSVQVIEQYYGRHAENMRMAARLGQ